MAEKQEIVQPEQFRFDDDGVFPNSLLPLLVYRKALRADGRDPAWLLEERFANNDWCNSWRNGVYSFAHYHSTTHEILGVYCGVATLRLGGTIASLPIPDYDPIYGADGPLRQIWKADRNK